MLERLAELVREEAEHTLHEEDDGHYPCGLCALLTSPTCYTNCPKTLEQRRLMLARWAVLLVAQALGKKVTDYQEAETGEELDEACMYLGVAMLDLITEATEGKQAEEVADVSSDL